MVAGYLNFFSKDFEVHLLDKIETKANILKHVKLVLKKSN